MNGDLFFARGRMSRIGYLSVLLAWGFGSVFVAMLADQFKDRFSPADGYLMESAVLFPFAWIQLCATVRRLNDVGWSRMLVLPWVPLCFWPLQRLLQTSLFPDWALLAIAALGIVPGFLLLAVKGVAFGRQIASATAPAYIAAPMQGGLVTRNETDSVRNDPPLIISRETVTTPKSSPREQNGEGPTGNRVRLSPVANPLVGWLVVIAGERVGTEYRIRAQGNRFGRSSDMEFAIADAGVQDREHAAIIFDSKNSQYTLVSLGAGFSVNGESGLTSRQLDAWDRLRFGSTTFVFIPLCGPWHRWLMADDRTQAARV